MRVFEIKTKRSNHPFLVMAGGLNSALGILYKKGIYDSDIVSVRHLDEYKSDYIFLEERLMLQDIIEKEVREELQKTMPRWHREPAGAAGGSGRDIYLIRTSKGNYFTSSCIGGTDYYLVLDTLEQLPGLPKE